MADKNYKLSFNMTDGTTQEVQFSVPSGETPKKGIDYFTEEDKEEFLNDVEAVRYIEQTLTDEQQAQARENIGVLEPLIGSTDDITPEQALQAIQSGRNIMISCESGNYGTLTFTSFHLAGSGAIVASSCAIDVQGAIINASLSGHTINNTWTCTTPTLVKQDDIPTVPTNVSAFTNDAGYLTEHQSLAGLATESYVNTQIAAIPTPDVSGQINTHNTATDSHKALFDKKLDVAELSTAIDDALAQAKESGEFDGVSPTIIVNKSNKITTLTIIEKDSSKVAIIEDGADGITPHIGENGNWFVGDTDTGKPSRGEDGSVGEATVTSDTIKNALGYTPADVTDIFKDTLQPTFTNIFDTVGIEYGKLLETDGTVSDTTTPLAITDFIPISVGDIVRVNDDFALYCVTGKNTPRVIVYDASFALLTMINNTAMIEGGYYIELLEKNADGHIVSFRVNKPSSAAYIRICNHTETIGKNPVLTINEEIKYEVGYGTQLNPKVRIDQSQIDNSPVKNGWNILPYERLNICYSGINRKPINTVEHFTDAATNFGYNALKCDVRPTSDGELICCHDAGFTFDSSGYITSYDSANQTKIHDVTAATVLGYSFKTGEHPCLVGDYLDVCRTHGKVAFITIRNEYMDVVIPKLLEELKTHNMTYSTIINCMTYESLVQWREQDTNVMINYTLNYGVAIDQTQIDRAAGLGYCSLCGFSLSSASTDPTASCDFEYARANGIRLLQAIAYKEGSPEACYAMGYDGCQIGIPWNPKSSGGNVDTYSRTEIDAIMGSYITDINTLVGGDS